MKEMPHTAQSGSVAFGCCRAVGGNIVAALEVYAAAKLEPCSVVVMVGSVAPYKSVNTAPRMLTFQAGNS